MDRAKVLIVEDEFLVRLTLAEALADDGFDVIEAGTADEAMAAIAAHDGLALILTDIQLPGGRDGVALVAAARERTPDIPVIFMSGRPDSLPRAASARDVFIVKPYLPSEVCAVARRLTGG